MSNKPAPLLRPERKIPTSIGDVTVHEMSWHDALEFLQLLSNHAKEFMNEEGRLAFSLPKIQQLVAGARELSDHLIDCSTDEQFSTENLPLTDGLLLLDAAIEVNLSQEVMALAKKTAGRFALAAGVRPAAQRTPNPPGPESSTPSPANTDGA